MPHRQAWSAASAEFPELALARDAVSLYLGCGHSAGNVERLLKLVALREHIRSPTFVHEAVLCSQAPKVKDVAHVSNSQGGGQTPGRHIAP